MRLLSPSAYALLCFFLFISICSFGQGNNQDTKKKKYNKSFKVYTNLGLMKEINTSRWNTTSLTTLADQYDTKPVGYFTPAFSIATTQLNYHEFELSRLVLNSKETPVEIQELTELEENTPVQNTTNMLLAVRYEFNLMVGRVKRRYTARPYIGFAFIPYTASSTTTPSTTALSATRSSNFGSTFIITPKVHFNMTEKFFLDINVPITMAQVDVSSYEGAGESYSGKVEYATLPGVLSYRIGLGMRLGNLPSGKKRKLTLPF